MQDYLRILSMSLLMASTSAIVAMDNAIYTHEEILKQIHDSLNNVHALKTLILALQDPYAFLLKDEGSMSILFQAIKHGNPEVIAFLVDTLKSNNTYLKALKMTNIWGQTPLHWAVGTPAFNILIDSIPVSERDNLLFIKCDLGRNVLHTALVNNCSFEQIKECLDDWKSQLRVP